MKRLRPMTIRERRFNADARHPKGLIRDATMTDLPFLNRLYRQNLVASKALNSLTDSQGFKAHSAQLGSQGGFLEEPEASIDCEFERLFFPPNGRIRVFEQISGAMLGFFSYTVNRECVVAACNILIDSAGRNRKCKSINCLSPSPLIFYSHPNLMSKFVEAVRLDRAAIYAVLAVTPSAHRLGIGNLLMSELHRSCVLEGKLLRLARVFELIEINGKTLTHPVLNEASYRLSCRSGAVEIGTVIEPTVRSDGTQMLVRWRLLLFQ